MTATPRVTAESHIDSTTISSYGTYQHSTPSVTVEVSFDLHDEDAALAALDLAVANVREQIEDAK